MVLLDLRVRLEQPDYRDLVDSRVLKDLLVYAGLEASMALLGYLALTVKMVVMEATESMALTVPTEQMEQTAPTVFLGKTVRMELEGLKAPLALKARKDLKAPWAQLVRWDLPASSTSRPLVAKAL